MSAFPSPVVATTAGASLEIAPLGAEVDAFRHLTYPRLGGRLERLGAGFVALGARLDGRAVGLLVGGVEAATASADIVSVMVEPDVRRQRIGAQLIAAFEALAVVAGATSLTARLASRMRGFEAAQRLFGAGGFGAPRLAVVNLTGEVGPMSDCVHTREWRAVLRRIQQPRAFDFEPWSALTPSESADLERLRAQPAYHRGFDFESVPGGIDPVCSLKIHRAGELIGWIVAGPLQNALARAYPDRVCRSYTSAYLDEALWHTGILMTGYYHAFSRQAAAYGERSIANYFSNMPRQIDLSRRRFAPMALHWDEVFQMDKALAGHDAAAAARDPATA